MMRRFFLFILVAVIAFSATAVRDVLAIDEAFYSSNDILLSDPDDKACAAGSALAGADAITQSFGYFRQKSLTAEQAAAIIGNLKQESQLNPKALNDKSGAYGILQWLGDRKTRLLAKSYYTDGATDKTKELGVQLDYLWEETAGTEKANFDTFLASTETDPAKLAIVFGEAFVRYNKETEEGKRAEYATQVFEQYGKSTSTGTGSCQNIGAGNFVYYSQKDTRWADIAYGSETTIGPGGCGPTSLAMIIATLVNKNVTPPDVAKVGAAAGSAVGGYTTHGPLLQAAAKKWGFSYENISSEPIESIVQVIKDGGLVYMGGEGPAPFTNQGHIVVIRGITADGKAIIGDPYRNEADVYPLETLKAYRGSTFAVKK